jgi:hypothetical protein
MLRVNPASVSDQDDPKRGSKPVVYLALMAACSFLCAGCNTLPQSSAASSQAATQPTQRISIQTTLPGAAVGSRYHEVLSVSGGLPPYRFAVSQGELPPGLVLSPQTGSISGSPTQAGSFAFTVLVTGEPSGARDSGASGARESGSFGTRTYTVTIGPCVNCVTVHISPAEPSVAPGGKMQFSAMVSNSSNTAVTWSASGGVITNTGLFTVPNRTAGTVFQIVATSRADSSVQGTTTLAIASPSSGGSGSGSTPPTGADNRYCNAGDIPNFGATDGPAATPTACFQTAQDSTPSPGSVTQVFPSSNLQTAIDNATCGETLVLQAGRTYPGFSLPAKNCDAGHYITIRSSALTSGLPAEGVRATPCNAGVPSLPGRPALNCASTSNVMARIAGVAKASHIISTAAGANYYRLVGLEIADTGANGAMAGYYDLIMLASVDHIIFDRCWIHGSPLGEDVKGVEFSSSSYIAVIDSYISDIHSKVSGYGADSSAIGSVTGTGPVKIVDNFLEASGATILWGGGASSLNVTDVELRRNHVFKPFTWWERSPTYLGTLFAVKNLFENKTGVRELVEGNIFENNWAQSQKGTAILFYPKNQTGKCPECTVHDVIFRYNIVRHAVNGIGMATTYATTCEGQAGNGTGSCQYLSGPLYNLSIHDNLLEDISQPTYWPGDCCSDGFLFAITTGQPTNWPHDIAIEHNTGFPVGSGIANVTIQGAPQVIANFSFNNNLMTSGNGGFHAVLPGNAQPGCNAFKEGSGMIGALNGCMGNTWAAVGNVFANTSSPNSSKFPGAPLPASNFEAPSLDSVGFVNFNNGNRGDYQLLTSSPYRNTASDGKDPGADVNALKTAVAGIE